MENAQTVFPLLTKDLIPSSMRPIWDRSIERRGEAKFIAGMGHAPELFDWYAKDFYQNLFYGGSVPVKYKELGRLRLSNVHGCRSCNKGNRLDAKENGLSDTQINHIDDIDNDAFDGLEKAVLKLADLVSMDGGTSELEAPLYNELKTGFSDGQIIELAMVLSMLSGIARFIFAFGLAEKEDYCAF